MFNQHLTASIIEQYVEKTLDDKQIVAIEQHLAACPACRACATRAHRVDAALHALPRTQPSSGFATRIGLAVEARVAQEQARRVRIPFIAIATVSSVLVALWFCLEVVIASQENGVFAFWALLTSYSDFFSADSLDALLALLEALPLTEILLMVCALLTVGILTLQLADSLRAHPLSKFSSGFNPTAR